MISRIEIKGFRALRAVATDLTNFQILIGPNASGKSTFLDAFAFLRDILNVGLERALLGDPRFDISRRAVDPRDLTWQRKGEDIEIAVEAKIPTEMRAAQGDNGYSCRYEVSLALDDQLTLKSEVLLIRKPNGELAISVLMGMNDDSNLFVDEASNNFFHFKMLPTKLALANLPEDEDRFPVSTWFKRLLMEDTQRLVLNAEALRLPSPASAPRIFMPDGSNLPWVVHHLEETAPQRLQEWVDHLRTALPDLVMISTRERPEDRSRYVVLTYDTGLEVPSWIISDGTLRLLALTLLAYSPLTPSITFIEEPENGIHPQNVETVYQSLSSVVDRQVFCATHSPILLSLAQPAELLCFKKDASGAVEVTRGD